MIGSTMKRPCPYCNGYYGKVQRHIRQVHLREKFPCLVCGKAYGREDTVVQHMRAAHKDHTFSCAHCRKMFITPEGLVAHSLAEHPESAAPTIPVPDTMMLSAASQSSLISVTSVQSTGNDVFTTSDGMEELSESFMVQGDQLVAMDESLLDGETSKDGNCETEDAP